jgi:hypothetical protein
MFRAIMPKQLAGAAMSATETTEYTNTNYSSEKEKDSNEKITLKKMLGAITASAVVIIVAIVIILGLLCVLLYRAMPGSQFVEYDQHGVAHEVYYHGKIVRELPDSEEPMDNDGKTIAVDDTAKTQ